MASASVAMKRRGITVLGRTVSECYYRVNVYASEVTRQIIGELLCAAEGTKAEYLSKEELAYMFAQGDDVVYPRLIRSDADPKELGLTQ